MRYHFQIVRTCILVEYLFWYNKYLAKACGWNALIRGPFLLIRINFNHYKCGMKLVSITKLQRLHRLGNSKFGNGK